MRDWLTAEEAMARLRIKPQTLYAYVSRGRVRAEPDPQDPRRGRYRESDIAALGQRKTRSRKVAEVAAQAIAWGEPVLESAITTVVDGRLYYRGRDAVALAGGETFEAVARLLRGAGEPPPAIRRPQPPSASGARERAFLALARRAAAAGGPATTTALASEAAMLPDLMCDAVVGHVGGGPIHLRLGMAWGCGPAGCDLIRRALVLLADHELNPSTFAARVAASTGAPLAAAALAGLATLAGPLHGDMAARVGALAHDAIALGAEDGLAARLAHNPRAPGFGHPLYPRGDPRARALLDVFTPPPALEALGAGVRAATGAQENVDFALAALSQALRLPPEAPFVLFATARTAGWVAHALEQRSGGAPIRPRARYVGAPI